MLFNIFRPPIRIKRQFIIFVSSAVFYDIQQLDFEFQCTVRFDISCPAPRSP